MFIILALTVSLQLCIKGKEKKDKKISSQLVCLQDISKFLLLPCHALKMKRKKSVFTFCFQTCCIAVIIKKGIFAKSSFLISKQALLP